MLIVQHACRHQIVMQKHSLKAIIKATLVNTLLPPQVIRNRTNNAQSILKMSRRLLYSLHLVLVQSPPSFRSFSPKKDELGDFLSRKHTKPVRPYNKKRDNVNTTNNVVQRSA
nr:MAG: immediate-early protein [White spot syndrome virus]BDX26482.1 MAG: immediate-early protein [White spot syndrome virus]BDX27330.1 MAG: immediate-early protein [White spot syndrome virus]